MKADTDTIAAIATPPGRGGVGVIRISGKNLRSIAVVLLGKLPQPRYATYCKFLDDQGLIIDQGIALYFPNPQSYTGEDVLELQGHGGPAVMSLLLNRCLTAGARLAQPGEFTLRAYLNNKIDLIQAESVADIIEANTAEAARCAVNSLQGHFSAKIDTLVQSLIALRTLVEATLDFPEEEIDQLYTPQITAQIEQIDSQLNRVFQSAQQGNLLQEGIKMVLIGAPNAGKSSLMNQLVEDDVAIVTEIAGTTRDTIERTIAIAGVPIHIVDTAGLRETNDSIERKGIERTLAAIKNANLVLRLMDCSQLARHEMDSVQKYIPTEKPQLTVFNKIDLIAATAKNEETETGSAIYLSAKTGEGVELLRQKILEIAGWRFNRAGEGIIMARQRHLEALLKAQQHLISAKALLQAGYQLELLAEELRLTQQNLSSITGEFTADDLLGTIFSQFCIGK